MICYFSLFSTDEIDELDLMLKSSNSREARNNSPVLKTTLGNNLLINRSLMEDKGNE